MDKWISFRKEEEGGGSDQNIHEVRHSLLDSTTQGPTDNPLLGTHPEGHRP
jgi:hypothetical protein